MKEMIYIGALLCAATPAFTQTVGPTADELEAMQQIMQTIAGETPGMDGLIDPEKLLQQIAPGAQQKLPSATESPVTADGSERRRPVSLKELNAEFGPLTVETVGRLIDLLKALEAQQYATGIAPQLSPDVEPIMRAYGIFSQKQWRWAFENTMMGYMAATMDPEERRKIEEARRQIQAMQSPMSLETGPNAPSFVGGMFNGMNEQNIAAVTPYLDDLHPFFGDHPVR